MILDDVFSSLDATTSAAITSNLLQSNGLLRDKRTTVIMTSHSGTTSIHLPLSGLPLLSLCILTE